MEAGDYYKEFVSRKFIAFSIFSTLLFWLAFTFLLLPLVPAGSGGWVWFWSAFSATPLAGVFFLAQHMFWLVAVEHRRAQRQRS